jgi:hypothetical protein
MSTCVTKRLRDGAESGCMFWVGRLAIAFAAAINFAFSTQTSACAEELPFVVIDGERIAVQPAFEDYAFMLEDACKSMDMTGEDCLIFPMMGNIKYNALATKIDGNRVIVYDRRLSSVVGGDGAQAVIAHELGHHYCGHLNKTPNIQHELEADMFAGAVMNKLGYSLEVSKSYVSILSKQPTTTHPDRAAREQAIEFGWLNHAAVKQCR